MRLIKFRIILILTLVNLFTVSSAGSSGLKQRMGKTKDTTTVFVSRFEVDNDRCFKCHGQEKYEYTNATLGKAGQRPDVF